MRHRAEQTWRYALGSDADRRHAERTAEALRAVGADEELVTAGLLHDVAKPAETRLWHRIAAVLIDRFAPALRGRFARGNGVFARYLEHARLGAEEARRRGASERVIRLIARHHEPPRDEDERRLQRADREALP
ncbi:MAG: HDIG domain-containing metalloprotein [Candidatus Limnocylindria bacterium]